MKSLLKGILTNIHTKLHQFLISSSVVFAQTERHAHKHMRRRYWKQYLLHH